jgi:hypothetical protein
LGLREHAAGSELAADSAGSVAKQGRFIVVDHPGEPGQ